VISANAGHFRHGFVETSVGSQGRTVRRAIVGMSAASGRAINMQQLYVSASRASEWVRVYTDDKADLLEAAMRDSRKLLALDLKAAADAAARAERAERERDEERTRRLAFNRRLGAEWDRHRSRRAAAWPLPSPAATTHAGKVSARRQQERGFSHGR
jgi:hypothetical protein